MKINCDWEVLGCWECTSTYKLIYKHALGGPTFQLTEGITVVLPADNSNCTPEGDLICDLLRFDAPNSHFWIWSRLIPSPQVYYICSIDWQKGCSSGNDFLANKGQTYWYLPCFLCEHVFVWTNSVCYCLKDVLAFPTSMCVFHLE